MKQNMSELNKDFWSERYEKGLLGWDTGSITTPIKDYFDQLTDKDLRILIPGCGNGYEAVYLHEQGFKNVTVVDLVDKPMKNLQTQCPNWQQEQFVIGDFFNLAGEFDLIIEQTFFCALDPSLRQKYADKIIDLLTSKGKLVGLLFTFPLTPNGPPFGGDIEEYRSYFEQFMVKVMTPSYNSIKPRMGSELFINLQKQT